MGSEPETQGSSGGPASRFRKVWGSKGLGEGRACWAGVGYRVRGLWPCPVTAAHPQISKPLMEKKRRARINVSLEQLRSLLEKHCSHQVRHRGMVVMVRDTIPSLLHPGLPNYEPFPWIRRSGNAS